MFVKCCQSTIYIKIPIKKLLYNIIYSFNIRPPKSSSATRKSHRFAPPRRCVCMPSWQHCLGDLGAGNRITLGKWSFPHPLWMIHWVKSPGAPPGDTVKTPCRRYSWIFIQDMVVFEVQNLSELETFFWLDVHPEFMEIDGDSSQILWKLSWQLDVLIRPVKIHNPWMPSGPVT